jgi:4-hydroxythreonine-4-phosphate dehydrogenase
MNNKKITPLGITVGDPAGVGPEIIVKLAHEGFLKQAVVIADRNLLERIYNHLHLSIEIKDFSEKSFQEEKKFYTNILWVQHVPLFVPCQPGKPSVEHATYVIETLKLAVQGCLQHNFSALVTGPVNKTIINQAGISFSGHTQFLAKLSQTSQTVMMLMTPKFKVACVTDHIPLKSVSAAITQEWLARSIYLVHENLIHRFGIPSPRILVCGLNPHAGENGYLGHEEQIVIIPTLQKLKQQGIDLQGPISADIAFTPKILNTADVVLAMYHDQGLPVIKYADFSHAINITLGLPFLRTSPDHGPAYDLAGTGLADSNSFKEAIKLAQSLSFPGMRESRNF